MTMLCKLLNGYKQIQLLLNNNYKFFSCLVANLEMAKDERLLSLCAQNLFAFKLVLFK